ncbi:hypothetical protein PC129_g22104 [Phytophthora cactorum]|uniref:Uncharacterized protein n=1 Tax=Phytophthora cactorum TaxID=29920 RepID=A0A329RBH4_9STRA|nr:hypothetical protein Pcac1_g15951 [Phytophthora cactorum]KAG2796014.1 hypothetical protein PC111_g21905 [Phytophthora cactorum]KAG2796169.1 hypothetical protein PC112_g22315 [Phytophthora cactorum]KAG2822066.1 hypothetical protein PC113_g22381 [Phytophthora cactorum]KAG2875197.1 hypothetical protein PC114_g24869 [Phytophthora cactorum]
MSPIATGNTSQQPRLADGIPNADVHGVIESSDPFELVQKDHSLSIVSDAHVRSSRNSDASSERLDRLERILEGMAPQQAQILANQLTIQDKLKRRAKATPTPPSEHSFNGSHGLYQCLRPPNEDGLARRINARFCPSCTNAHAAAKPAAVIYARAAAATSDAATASGATDRTAGKFRLKIPKPRDLDGAGFSKFSGNGTSAGVGADFKSWGLRLLQRLVAAQQMSGDGWPE